jgi:hypothetical protein
MEYAEIRPIPANAYRPFYLNDFVVLCDSDILKVYDIKTQQLIHDVVYKKYRVHHALMGNMLLCSVDNKYKLLVITEDKITTHDIVGTIPSDTRLYYYGGGLLHFQPVEYLDDYTATLTKVILPDKILYAFTDITKLTFNRYVHPIVTKPVVTQLSDCELTTYVDNTENLLLCKFAAYKEMTVNNVEELNTSWDNQLSDDVDQCVFTKLQMNMVASFPNIKSVVRTMRTYYNGDERVIVCTSDSNKQLRERMMMNHTDTSLVYAGTTILQICMKTLSVTHIVVNMVPDIIAIDDDKCITYITGIYRRQLDGTLVRTNDEMLIYDSHPSMVSAWNYRYIENAYIYFTSSKDRLSFIKRNDFSVVEVGCY